MVLSKHHIEDLPTLMTVGCDVGQRLGALQSATHYVSPALIWIISLVWVMAFMATLRAWATRAFLTTDFQLGVSWPSLEGGLRLFYTSLALSSSTNKRAYLT
jgi:hypothetical protein